MNFTNKRIAEDVILSVDYSTTDVLADGETIVSATWTNSVRSGTDPAPQNMLSGAASINGLIVSQLLIDGVLDVWYWPICTALTSLGQTLVLPDPGQGSLHVVA